MNRDEVIQRLNQIGDVFTLSLRTVTDDTAFENTAGFAAEMIPHTVNGYQRFLDDITKSAAGRVIAGFVIRFKQLLLIEFGEYVIASLENELVTLSPNDIIAAEKGEGHNETTLWKIAHPDNPDLAPPSEYDLLTSFLLLMQMKNLIIRAGAQQQMQQDEKDAAHQGRKK
ncbi:hypothetical protein G173_gp172 [Erwinia phage phiEaH2]|nr:hypothetical protein G173_gp172 [Erwinia phage phiEaH2]AFQ96717.1 hypothetical protein [Erwinia phage phiEaH2]